MLDNEVLFIQMTGRPLTFPRGCSFTLRTYILDPIIPMIGPLSDLKSSLHLVIMFGVRYSGLCDGVW